MKHRIGNWVEILGDASARGVKWSEHNSEAERRVRDRVSFWSMLQSASSFGLLATLFEYAE